jgi:hypothetical protein
MIQVQYPLFRLVYYFVLELTSFQSCIDNGLNDGTIVGILDVLMCGTTQFNLWNCAAVQICVSV